MDKINNITEPYDDVETQNVRKAPAVTYDSIMDRLTRHFIRQESSNTIPRVTQPQNQQKVASTSAHITSKINKQSNNEKMPGYVKPYRGQPPTGQLNTPAFKQQAPIVNKHNYIDENIQNIIQKEQRGEMGISNDINQREMENKLLLMRKIALHNNKVMNDKNRALKTQLKFQ